MDTPELPRISRRDAMKWMLTASASIALTRYEIFGAETPPATVVGSAAKVASAGYGTDPDLMKSYKPGDFWPLTLTELQRKSAAILCDTIIPADDHSPSASKVGVVDFIDEWISAPYPGHDKDRTTIVNGIAWLDTESTKRFGKTFSEIGPSQVTAICDDICYAATAAPAFADASRFFTLFRNLTAGGFYTTPEGMKDLKYVGNVPTVTFEGPPLEALKKVGLA